MAGEAMAAAESPKPSPSAEVVSSSWSEEARVGRDGRRRRGLEEELPSGLEGFECLRER